MSGVGFLAAVKTFTPAGRRRRRCEKQQKVLELPPGYSMQPDVVPCWDAAPPITPPAAFLPPGYKKGFPEFLDDPEHLTPEKESRKDSSRWLALIHSIDLRNDDSAGALVSQREGRRCSETWKGAVRLFVEAELIRSPGEDPAA
ncbi:hypothetical protein WN48_01380 [Eufriesea mexicana]|uniref:Uncharacterized protein n=1 Tax=Eufriesea mexicana TaxID=516756 RepID=A0A310STY0_9HYME|nr:hypothetical protein WN48_01380 [Eufriesea mexicana]